MTAYHQVIGVPDERRAAVLHRSGMNATPVIGEACGLLQPVQCDIQTAKAKSRRPGEFPPRSGANSFPGLENPCFQPIRRSISLAGKPAEHFPEVLVAVILPNAPARSASSHPPPRLDFPHKVLNNDSIASWQPRPGRNPYDRGSNRASHSGSSALRTRA